MQQGLPGPANLFSEEDNQTGKSITQVMQENMDQVLSCMPTWHNFYAGFSRIFNRRRVPNDGLSHYIRRGSESSLTSSSKEIQGAECCGQLTWCPHISPHS
jgi:hypothetical protein